MENNERACSPEARVVVDELGRIYQEVRAAKGLFGLLKVVPLIVQEVESFGASHDIKGADKKCLAIDVALLLIPLPVWAPKPLLRLLLGWLIDRAVVSLNKLTK